MSQSKLELQRPSKRRAPIVIWQLLLGVLILAAWQALSTAGLLDKFFFSRPSDVLARVVQWVLTGSIWTHLLVTLEEAFLSFAIGVAAGILFGFLLARTPFLSDLLSPYIRVLNA